MFSPRKALYFLFVIMYISKCMGDLTYPKPDNCKTLECPFYTVVHSQKEFEIRNYKEAAWLSGPKIQSDSYTVPAFKGFRILFDYIQGNNKERVKINMTAPAIVEVQNKTYTVYFYVPQKYQNGTPLPHPLSNDITQVKFPKQKYAAVTRFDGFITEERIPRELDALKKSLKGTSYERAAALDAYNVAGYNSPFELINRVNEIIIFFD